MREQGRKVGFWQWAGKPSASVRRKRAHSASRGEKWAIAKSPVRSDSIAAKEDFLSPLRDCES